MIGAVWRYRGLIAALVVRDFRSRYLGSVLGGAWNIIQPLVLVLVYTVVFARVIGAKLGIDDDPYAYGVYLCAGLLPWNAMAEVIERGKMVFIDHANLLKKASFPRVCLPVTAFATAGINFAIPFALFLLLTTALIGWRAPAQLAWFVPLLTLHALFALGVGVWAGTLNVFFRDVGQVVSVVLQLGFWLTPIVYVAEVLPDNARSLLSWNPLTGLMQGYQSAALGRPMPPLDALLPMLFATALVLVGGAITFRRCAGELVDEL